MLGMVGSARVGGARIPSLSSSSELNWIRSHNGEGASKVNRVEAVDSQFRQYIGPFHGQDLPAVEAAAEAVKVDYEIVTDPAGAADLMQQQAERVREVAGDVGEAYAATAELFLKNGGAIVRLMQTDRGGTLEAFWCELLERGHQNIANGPTNAECAAIAAKDVAATFDAGVFKARAGEMGQRAATPQMGA